MNRKQSGNVTSKVAAKALGSSGTSKIQKSLAGSVVAQTNTNKQTSKAMETKASNVLKSNKYSAETKSLAGSVLSQSNKKR